MKRLALMTLWIVVWGAVGGGLSILLLGCQGRPELIAPETESTYYSEAELETRRRCECMLAHDCIGFWADGGYVDEMRFCVLADGELDRECRSCDGEAVGVD